MHKMRRDISLFLSPKINETIGLVPTSVTIKIATPNSCTYNAIFLDSIQLMNKIVFQKNTLVHFSSTP